MYIAMVYTYTAIVYAQDMYTALHTIIHTQSACVRIQLHAHVYIGVYIHMHKCIHM